MTSGSLFTVTWKRANCSQKISASLHLVISMHEWIRLSLSPRALPRQQERQRSPQTEAQTRCKCAAARPLAECFCYCFLGSGRATNFKGAVPVRAGDLCWGGHSFPTATGSGSAPPAPAPSRDTASLLSLPCPLCPVLLQTVRDFALGNTQLNCTCKSIRQPKVGSLILSVFLSIVFAVAKIISTGRKLCSIS